MTWRVRLFASLTLAALPLARAQQPDAAGQLQRFTSATQTFHIDLPAGWRQLSPGDARELRAAHPDWPEELLHTEPGLFYVVGDVDRWHRGEFDGVYLQVLEQGNEWQTDGIDVTAALRSLWQQTGREQGCTYEIDDVQRCELGSEGYAAIQCRRRAAGGPGADVTWLDTYVPTGGRQLSLAFRCPTAVYPRWQQRFRDMLSTLTLARKAHGEVTLSDRLWTPILTGVGVGVLLAVLYRWTRKRN